MRPFANGKIGLTSERVQEKPIEMLSGETVIKIASRATIFCVALRYHILIFYSYFCYYHTMQSLLLQDHSPTTNQLNHFLKISFLMLNFNHFFPDDIFIKLAIIRCLRHKSKKRVVFDDEYAGRYTSYARKKTRVQYQLSAW